MATLQRRRRTVVVDRVTGLNAISGVVLAARGYDLPTALFFATVTETMATVIAQRDPRSNPVSAPQFGFNVLVGLLAWWAAASTRRIPPPWHG